MKYQVKMSNEANEDFYNYIYHIIYEYDASVTASKHHTGIIDAIFDLAKNPFVNEIRTNFSLLKYGMNVRRHNFKKMAIIYTVHDDTVFIHRIVAASMVTGL